MSVALEAKDLRAGYGPTVVLDGISLAVPAGGTLAVLGRNGVGKTTLLATLMGLTTLHEGAIVLGGQPVQAQPTHLRNELGLGYVPQEREIFPSLTVEENMAVALRAGGWTIDAVFDLFPGLKARRRNTGNRLSGGEQQMLAIGRALVGAPKVLLLDEPLEGLAPVVIEALVEALDRVQKESRLTVLLVEQKAELALSLTQEAIILDRGQIVYHGASTTLKADEATQARLLGVAERRR
jgi:branched-chain amino acid transport system ATP-binding protein